MAVLALVAALIAGLLAWLPAPPARAADATPQGFQASGVVPAGGVLELDAGASEQTVIGNLTVVAPAAPGYLTLYPCTAARPLASNINFVAGQTIANQAIVKSGADGKICVYASSATHILWDQSGYAQYLTSYAARRMVDTRTDISTRASGPGAVARVGSSKVAAGQELVIPVQPAFAGPNFIAGNLTIAQPEAAGRVDVYPCGAWGGNSTAHFAAGQTIAAFTTLAIGKAGAMFAGDTGSICVRPTVAAHVLWDDVAQGFIALNQNQTRLLDTRNGWTDINRKPHPGWEPVRHT